MKVNLRTQCGVYQVKNRVNGKLYIGSTTTPFSVRFGHHKSNLRHNKHGNPHLQNAWNKYGESSFEFSVLEVCDKPRCFVREQFYIDTLSPVYNVLPLAGIVTGYKHTQASKDKISKAFRGKNHPAYSGEYVFYHPTHGYFKGGMVAFDDHSGFKSPIGHKLKSGILNQSHGWVYVGKSSDALPKNIELFYSEKVRDNRPVYTFRHKSGETFNGTVSAFLAQYPLDRSTIYKLTTQRRKTAFGWTLI